MPGPLPVLTPENEFFWTCGQDGVLRVQQCATCLALRHPPGPVCPRCASDEHEATPVSGRGTVVGFTVNCHQWLPSMPPPYVIAIVALDEDDAVRLTTNVVNCPAADVRVGMRVRVTFEQHDDVWLPLFSPIAEADRHLPPEPDIRADVRSRPTHRKFEDDVVISGVGASPIGRRLLVDPLSLTITACRNAVYDAGLTLADIDGLSTYPGDQHYSSGHSEGGVTPVEESLRIQPTWVNGASDTPGQAGAVIAAMLAVAAGLCRHVLCFRTVWESTAAARGQLSHPIERAEGVVAAYRYPFGAMSAANWIAPFASNYFARYGGTREVLGRIAMSTRAYAALNPEAIYTDPMSLDDYMNARLISTPLGLYDCDVPCDGAIAFVVSAADVANDLRAPVRVEAVGTQILERLSWDQSTLSHEPQVFGPSAHLWTRTTARHEDIDIAMLYDGFTFNCLSWLEALGFCELGQGSEFIGDGSAIALGGRLPVNTHGGQLSAGRTHGFGGLREAVTQLRGEAAGRQVADAELAVVTTGGGVPSSAMLLRR